MCAGASALLYKLTGTEVAKSPVEPMTRGDVSLDVDSQPADDDDVLDQRSAFVPRRVALSLLRSRRPRDAYGVAFRRGLSCECCVHQCSYSELMGYCRDGAPLLQ